MLSKMIAKGALITAVTFALYGCAGLSVGGGAGKSGSLPITSEKVSQLQVGKTSYDQAVTILGLPVSVENCCGQAWIAKWEHSTSGGAGVSVAGIGGSGNTAATDHLELYFNPKTKVLVRVEQFKTQYSSGGLGM